MENQPVQSEPIIQPTPTVVPAATPAVAHHIKYRGLIIGIILALVVILVVVLVHKKENTPEQDLQKLEDVSLPVTTTVEQRATQLSNLGSNPSESSQ